MKYKFYVPLTAVVIMSVFLGNFAKSQMEYDAMIRVNQIQEQSFENVKTHREYKEFLASLDK